MLTLNGICWCLLVSFGVWRFLFSVLWCLEMRGGCLRSYSKDIWVLFMNVIKVWVPPREYLSVQALYDAANALYWKISERQNSTHLAFLKHQNTKTSLCELSKSHWVIAPFYISGSIKRKLQSTVSLDHPVCMKNYHNECCSIHFQAVQYFLWQTLFFLGGRIAPKVSVECKIWYMLRPIKIAVVLDCHCQLVSRQICKAHNNSRS